MRATLTFLVVTLPRKWREWRWRRVQKSVSAGWIHERKQRNALRGLAED